MTHPFRLVAAAIALCLATPALAAPDWHDTVRAFAVAHCKHPAWGYVHSARDYALAAQLARADGVALDDDVLFAASYLHDIAAFAPYAKAGEDHSDTAADLVGTILAPTGFPMAKLPAVQAAIRTHMFYRAPQGAEAIYLHDADALDWLGAIGVARIIATTEHGDPPAKVVDPYSAPDLPAAVALIETNLKDAAAGVQSPAGKARVPGLVAEARAFLAQLKAESEDGKAL